MAELFIMNVEHPVVALDYGEARIGVAATDLMGIAVHGVESADARSLGVLPYLADLIRERGAKLVLIGLPLLLDGSEGRSSKKVRKFGKKLAEYLPEGVVVEYADERNTTNQASEKLREAGRKAKNQRAVIDQVAAMEILREWLRDQGEDF